MADTYFDIEAQPQKSRRYAKLIFAAWVAIVLAGVVVNIGLALSRRRGSDLEHAVRALNSGDSGCL